MDTVENKLKTTSFWLKLGIVNHLLSLLAVSASCVYSGFTCQGELMKDALSIYAFTIFTPQLALEVIVLMALLLVSSSLSDFSKNIRSLALFISTLSALILFAILKS